MSRPRSSESASRSAFDRGFRWVCFYLVIGMAAAVAAPLAAAPPVTFTDVALEAGFQDRLAHGRAMVAADFNLDGWVDFYLGNPGEPVNAPDESLILWNNGPDGQGRFTFTRGQVLLRSVIAFTAAAADYDNDGDQDLFVGEGGQEGIGLDHLYRNDGGVFVDVSEQAAIRGPKTASGEWVPTATSSGNFADYDNDGDLDLFVSSRINFASLILPGNLGWRNSLFRNNGDGTFTDVSAASGLATTFGTMTAVWGDFDNDGWMDLYVPKNTPGYNIYRNNHDGTFTDVPLGIDIGARAVWSSSVEDFNRDGLLDILSFARGVPGNTDPHALFINHGGWSFTNESISSGLSQAGQTAPSVMGTAVGDFNNDGYPDVYMGNGGPLFTEKDRLFLNTTEQSGNLTFLEVSSMIDYGAQPDPSCVPPALPDGRTLAHNFVDHYNMLAGMENDCGVVDMSQVTLVPGDPCNPAYPYRGHGSLFVDYDEDGDLDLAAIKGGTAIIAPEISSTEPNRLFRNDGGNAYHWLFLELEGTVSNRDAYGARIEVFSHRAGGSAHTTVEQVQGNTGFSSSGPREIHFGLGRDDLVDQVRVAWPSGVVTRLYDVVVDQRLRITEDVLLASDFNDGQAPGWHAVKGHWDVKGGVYGADGSQPAMSLWTAGGAVSDATLVSKVTYRAGAPQISLLGRASSDGRTFYSVTLGDGQARLYRSLGGQLTMLGEPLQIDAMTPGRAYIVSLAMHGSTIQMTVDRRLAPPVVDTAISSGLTGLATGPTRATFDNVTLY